MSDWIFGINPVREALSGRRRRPLELFLAREGNTRLQELAAAAEQAGVPVRRCVRAELERLTGGARHQGAALRLEPFAYVELADLLAASRKDEKPGFCSLWMASPIRTILGRWFVRLPLPGVRG
jgi:23S rRNA (guanosine2251-2'-O)-methyltransferase